MFLHSSCSNTGTFGVRAVNTSVEKHPLSFDRQQLSYGGCLEVKREYYQNCCVQCCVPQFVFLCFYVSLDYFGFLLLVSFVGFGFLSTEPRDWLERASLI